MCTYLYSLPDRNWSTAPARHLSRLEACLVSPHSSRRSHTRRSSPWISYCTRWMRQEGTGFRTVRMRRQAAKTTPQLYEYSHSHSSPGHGHCSCLVGSRWVMCLTPPDCLVRGASTVGPTEQPLAPWSHGVINLAAALWGACSFAALRRDQSRRTNDLSVMPGARNCSSETHIIS